ncbi:MAG: hypothetical protein ABIH41_07355, partial [Nanoarchaeota archaeon]
TQVGWVDEYDEWYQMHHSLPVTFDDGRAIESLRVLSLYQITDPMMFQRIHGISLGVTMSAQRTIGRHETAEAYLEPRLQGPLRVTTARGEYALAMVPHDFSSRPQYTRKDVLLRGLDEVFTNEELPEREKEFALDLVGGLLDLRQR